ncbi:uncharacterized protein [Lolium perenne]|uniref:uncharacterized protein n=1 Tax=Lolium perenne TaxID=4522 RepID=UPI003A990699
MAKIFLHGCILIVSGHQPTTTASEPREEAEDGAPATEATRRRRLMWCCVLPAANCAGIVQRGIRRAREHACLPESSREQACLPESSERHLLNIRGRRLATTGSRFGAQERGCQMGADSERACAIWGKWERCEHTEAINENWRRPSSTH